MTEPTSVDEYKQWAKEELGDDLSADSTRRIYETNVGQGLSALQQTGFVRGLSDFLEGCDERYRAETSSRLRMTHGTVEFAAKPFDSVINKLFRLNVVWNRSYPKAPKDGWYTSKNMYARIDDLIRTTVVCKFLDGPEFLAEALTGYSVGLGLDVEARSLEREEGYYAFHVYPRFALQVVDETWSTTDTMVEVEIQITTQLQEVLRELTHRFYEEIRLQRVPDKKLWKWQSNDPRFRAGFLSHSLHMLEGLILELRNDA